MKKIYFAVLAAMLLFPVSGALAQHHIGLGAELMVPLTPYSKGYGAGYGISFMYRKFEMMEPFMFDGSIGFSRTSAKDEPIIGEDQYGLPEIITPEKLGAYFWKLGFAWAFIPNASPFTQPYAGFDFGYSLNTEGGQFTHNQYLAGLRLGWMAYVNERFLFGLEMKYNGMIAFDGREDSQYTSIGGLIDHQMSVQLSTNIQVGR